MSAAPYDFDRAYTQSIRAWTQHIEVSHSVRKVPLYRGRIEKCLVCWAFKRKVRG